MQIKCDECDGYGLIDWTRAITSCACKGAGKRQISAVDMVLLKIARKLKRLLGEYGQ